MTNHEIRSVPAKILSKHFQRPEQKHQSRRTDIRSCAKRVLKNESRDDVLRATASFGKSGVIVQSQVATEPVNDPFQARTSD